MALAIDLKKGEWVGMALRGEHYDEEPKPGDTPIARPLLSTQEPSRTPEVRPSKPSSSSKSKRLGAFFSPFGWFKNLAFSSILRRIVFLNLAALFILVAGIQFLNQFRAGLIDARVESLLTQGKIIGAAITARATVERDAITIDPDKLQALEVGGEADVLLPDVDGLEFLIDPQEVAPVLRRLISPAKLRARIYDREGDLILDSRFLYSGGSILRFDLPKIDAKPPPWWEVLYNCVNDWTKHSNFPVYEDHGGKNGRAYPEVANALRGNDASVVRVRDEGQLIVSVAVPVQRARAVLGALLLSTEGSDIDEIVQAERTAIYRVFLVASLVTVFLSVGLAGTIATPLRRLASAADNVRATGSQVKRLDISEFENRRDEIGHLSHSLKDMTDALHTRMEAIGQFAADVSHELKNPLTSLRSAVETLPLVKNDESREKLLGIIQHDVRRLDRLITDISDASRLDAELAREKAEPVSIKALTGSIVSLMQEVYGSEPKIELVLPATTKGDLIVQGHESRLGQVLNNLIDNARSFVPSIGGRVRILVSQKDKWIEIIIEDNGPGIDPNAFERIFRRFYTDRPSGDAGEDFGKNSGLGLSISKQIVEAHNGTIEVENVLEDMNGSKKRAGARFIIRLPVKSS